MADQFNIIDEISSTASGQNELEDKYLFDNIKDLTSDNVVAIGSSGTGVDLIISDLGSNYTPQPLVASIVKISSTSASDISDGTGARSVRLYGLDANYNRITEDIILNGQNPSTSIKEFLFIDKLRVLTTGAGTTNSGSIYAGTGTVSSGVPVTKWLMITAGIGKTRAGFYGVPAGYSMIINRSVFRNNTATNDCFIKWWTRTALTPYIQEARCVLAGRASEKYDNIYVIPEKTIIKITGYNITSTSDLDIITGFRLVKD